MNNLDHSAQLPWQELILGGQKSGKTRRAEQAARVWMDQAPSHASVYLATGQAWDAEMRVRIERHQIDRTMRVPGMRTVEAPRQLAQALSVRGHAAQQSVELTAPQDALWREGKLPEPLRKARAHPQWSALNPQAKLNQAERQENREALAQLLAPPTPL